MRPVEHIEFGKCFRKKNGEFAYLRISDNSARFFGLKYETHVYGVGYNGSMTEVERGKMVEPVDASVMEDNRSSEDNWNERFAKNMTP